MADNVVLYDLPGIYKGDGTYACFSFNVWKTRMILSYKKIPYTTTWCEYPDVSSTLRGLGIPANSSTAWAEYTLPAIRLPNGDLVMDSHDIAKELERRYPSPPLYHDEVMQVEIENAVQSVFTCVCVEAWIQLVHGVLPERSAEWWRQNRERRLAMSLEAYVSQSKSEDADNAADQALRDLRNLIVRSKRDHGPFVLGSQVSYGDFAIAAFLESIERTHAPTYERLLGQNDVLHDLHLACKDSLKRDS